MESVEAQYRKRKRIRRVERAAMYAGLAASGVFLTISPSPLVQDQVSVNVQYFWSVAMILSALLCLWGSITDRWLGEYGGIFMLVGTMWFYGGTATLAWKKDHSNFTLLGFSLILIAFGFGLLARWRDVRIIKLQASEDIPNTGD